MQSHLSRASSSRNTQSYNWLNHTVDVDDPPGLVVNTNELCVV